jgi:hypothetical protein
MTLDVSLPLVEDPFNERGIMTDVASGQDGPGDSGRPASAPSEYERHLTDAGPPPADGLAGHYADARRLARETGLPPEFFYGLLRRDLPTELAELAELVDEPADARRDALLSAGRDGVIPPLSPAQAERLNRRLDRHRVLTSPLDAVAPELGLEPGLPLLATLAGHGIRCLADVRAAGGVPHLAGLPGPDDDPAVRVLEAHAALSVLPVDHGTAAALVEGGFESVAAIADASPAALAAALAGDEPDPEPAWIHRAATIQARYLDGVVTGARTSGAASAVATPAAAAALAAALPADCRCAACEEATSPGAYLVDLLDYAVRHLRNQGAPVTLTDLTGRFHQPFADLPLTCSATGDTVRQVRICIEVLRTIVTPQAASYTPRWFVEAAYLQFLEELGTSYDELRRGATLDYRDRVALAGALGLYLDPDRPARPDILDELTVDPHDPAQLSAQTLEAVFGLRDTAGDPLTPAGECSVLRARLEYLRSIAWWRADWPETPSPAAPPLVDPDLVGPADMVYDVLTPPGVNRVPNQPVHFWEDRQRQIQNWALTIREVREEPRAGFDALITDRVVIDGRPIQFGVGLNITLPEFEDLRARRRAGEDLTAVLGQNRLTQEGFDYLAGVRDTLHLKPPGTVLAAEWEAVSDILVQRLKRLSYPTWRQEEKALGLTLSPQHFKLRPPAVVTGLAWLPRRWRSTVEARERWEDTLRARIEQEQAAHDAVRSAVDAVESRLLAELRNELIRIWALPGLITPARLTALTQQLQLDCEAGGDQLTTRLSQALETVQGVLFGARNGLLEGGSLTLDAPAFDEEWRWLGSYASWRAAMEVFLYPENAARPILRRDQSPAFRRLVTDLQRSVPVSPDAAQRAADRYAEYFQDVCALTVVAVYENGTWPGAGSGTTGPPCLIVARGPSGKLYFATFEFRPAWYLSSVPGHTMWAEIEGLPPGSSVVGFLPHQPEPGSVHVGVYARHVDNGTETLLFADYDGRTWQRPRTLSELPPLVTATDYRDGVIPPDPALGGAGRTWRVHRDDRLVPLYAEGFGSLDRTAVLVLAGTTDGGRRRVGLLRGRDGGLVLTAETTIDGAWTPAGGREPVLLWGNGIQRVVLTRPDGGVTQLGLLGTNWPQDRGLSLSWQTTDGFVREPGGSTWAVRPDALLVPADLGGPASSLLALGYESTTDQHGWRDRSTRGFVLRPAGTGLELGPQFLVNNPHHEGVDMCASATHVAVAALLPLRFASSGTFLGLGQHGHRYAGGLTCTISVYASVFAWELDWDPAASRLRTRGTVPETNQDPPPVPLQTDDAFVVVPLPNGTEGALLAPSAGRPELAVVAHRNGRPGVTWQSVQGALDPAGAGAVGAWPLRPGDRFITLGLADQRRLVVVRADGSELAGLRVLDDTGRLAVDWRLGTRVPAPDGRSGVGWLVAGDARYAALPLAQGDVPDILALAPDGRLGVLHSLSAPDPNLLGYLRNVGPINVRTRDVIHRNSSRWPADRKALVAASYLSNESPSLRRYLDEAFLFVPLQIAQRLRESGHHTAALDWLRSVYDYERPPADRKVAYRLVIDEHAGEPGTGFDRDPDWVGDPVNPHAIAETRPHAYTTFTLLAVVRCLLDFADAEFARATSESVPRARELYLEALELLGLPELRRPGGCEEVIGELVLEIGDEELQPLWDGVLDRLRAVRDAPALGRAAEAVAAALADDGAPAARVAAAQGAAGHATDRDATPDAGTATTYASLGRDATRRRAHAALLTDQDTALTAIRLVEPHRPGAIRREPARDAPAAAPAPSYAFCVPANPVIRAVRSHAETNLRKIRLGRNIAGLELRLDPYAAPTVAETDAGALAAPSAGRALQPLPYRYAVLADRARQLVQLAQQIESSMLSALQSLDQARYEAARARHDLTLAEAGVRLRDLQLAEARDGITAAEDQRRRAQLQAAHYRGLLDEGISLSEATALGAMTAALAAETAGLYSVDTLVKWAGAAAPVFGRLAELSSTVASYERRAQEWAAQRDLAAQDVSAAGTQIRLAHDRTRIAAQDRAIAALGAQHAASMLDFIETQKFGNEALYEWMSGVLEQIYRFFLQNATSIARLAEAQLAFERQEVPPAVIQADYWEAPAATGSPGTVAQGAPDVRGLTGSARLLRDIVELDQHAFRTDRRKLQLTETISLAQADPVAFQRFRQSGVLPFATPMERFDRRFPGHFLRLIRSVRTSVIALVPPTEGIRATLATSGSSRVVIGGPRFPKVRIERGPESVALTSPLNNSGVFDLDPQPELLVPFEGIGVEASWEFRLPKPANQIDYGAIADVLITIDYTALDSADHRQRVLGTLDPRFRADRPFSFRRDFPDAWYDLHNSELLADADQLVVRFRTEREDFPPNLDGLAIMHAVLYLVVPGGQDAPLDRVTVTFTPDLPDAAGNRTPVGGVARPVRGVISTRAGAWQALIGQRLPGEWAVSLRPADDDPQREQKLAAVRAWLRSTDPRERCDDILLAVSYSARTPAWPEP